MRYQSTGDALRVVLLVCVVSMVIGVITSMLVYALVKHVQRSEPTPQIKFEEPMKPP